MWVNANKRKHNAVNKPKKLPAELQKAAEAAFSTYASSCGNKERFSFYDLANTHLQPVNLSVDAPPAASDTSLSPNMGDR